jgi:hypothetical protein
LGIVGPTRMQYGRAVAVVRYLTQLLNDLLADTYNPQDVSAEQDEPGDPAPDGARGAEYDPAQNAAYDMTMPFSDVFRGEGS